VEDLEGLVTRRASRHPLGFSWGSIAWVMNDEWSPETTMTVGEVTIGPGQSNDVHAHETCEEVLVLVAGELDHRVGGDVVSLRPGDAIRIPPGLVHGATNTGAVDAVMIVCYPTPRRDFVRYDKPSTAPS
jgi:quercetin dioxygenase-like cupin family protein